jgi:hypothetical protein
MYYSYRRRSNGSTFFIWLIISAVVILLVSPRARQKVGTFLGTLSTALLGVSKDIGRKVNEVGTTLGTKFRTYTLSDLTGSFMKTYRSKNGQTTVKQEDDHDRDHEDVYFHDLSEQTEESHRVNQEDLKKPE